jgi:hypothetical protein
MEELWICSYRRNHAYKANDLKKKACLSKDYFTSPGRSEWLPIDIYVIASRELMQPIRVLPVVFVMLPTIE